VIELDVIEARVRKCIDESNIVDKKMRTRTFKYEKYIIPLSNNHPFSRDEFVKVVRKKDFDKLARYSKEKTDSAEQLKKEIKELMILLEKQREHIEDLEDKLDKKSIRKIIGI
jgi:hypothetical protein